MKVEFEVFYYSDTETDVFDNIVYPAYRSSEATVDVPFIKSLDDLPYITSEQEQYIESHFNDLIDDLGELESYLPFDN
jgi:hypothetical protein